MGRKAYSIGKKISSIKNSASSAITKAKHQTKNYINKGKYLVNHAQASIMDKIKPTTVPRVLENKIDYINNAKANELRAPDSAKKIWAKEAQTSRNDLDKKIKQHFAQRARVEEQAFQKSQSSHAAELAKSKQQFKQLGLSHPTISQFRGTPIHEHYNKLTNNHFKVEDQSIARVPNYRIDVDHHDLAYAKTTKPFRANPTTGIQQPVGQSGPAHFSLVRETDAIKNQLKDQRKTTNPDDLKNIWTSSRISGGSKNGKKKSRC